MTTNYPGAFDTFSNPTSSDTLAVGGPSAIPHASQHANLNDAVFAIQTKLGTTSIKALFPAGITIPVTPTANTDAVSKQYVDAAITGMNIHESCEVATTAPFASVTYADGVTLDLTGGYGPGSTLTNTGTLAAFILDGYTPAQYDRVLVKNQGDARQNGIYSLTTVGSGSVDWVLTRATDYDNGNAVEVNAGDLIYIIHGTQAGAYIQTNEGSYSGAPQGGIIIKAGTGDTITFTQISGVNATATTATNLAGTTTYSIPYQSGSATTTYLSIGTANQLLAVNSGATGYTWTTPSSLTVGSATNATNVANTTTTSSSTFYVNFGATNTTTNQGTNTNASLTYVPSTGTLSATVISGTSLGGSLLSSATPLMSGTASAGASLVPARDNHVHPTDTSRASVASPTFTGTVTVPNTGIVYPGSTSGQSIVVAPATAGTNTSIVLPSTAGTLVISSSPTLTTPTITTINAGSTTATASLFPDVTVTTGSIAIGAGLTTGSINIANAITTGGINIATTGTGVTPIAIGHTNATIGLTGNTTVTGTLTTTSTINKVTVTAPTTSATLTLVTGSSLITSGAFALTLTSTAITNATIPSGTVTLQDLGTAQSITGVKTFSTAPVISTITNTGTITLPTSSDTLVGRATSDTLTNKDLTSPTNIFPAQIVAGKNAVINGGMDIWQRGTSIALAASASTTYLADRWCTQTGANQATTISRQPTSDTTNLPNIQYCMRYQRNSGQTGVASCTILNNFETINSIPFVGKTVTLSFYARAGANYSSASSILGATLIYGTGTDQNAFSGFTGQGNAISQSAALTTTWQRFSYSATVGTSVTQLALDFACTPTGTAGTNDYYEITGVQLELGSVATAFSRAGGSIGGELAACKRYFEMSFPQGTTPANGTSALSNTIGAYVGISMNNSYSSYVPFQVEKRIATPTITLYGNSSGYWGYTASSAAFTYASNAFTVANGGSNGFSGSQTQANNTFLVVTGHWTASAEL